MQENKSQVLEQDHDAIATNAIATEYIKLVLRLSQFDSDVIDAYYGFEKLKPSPLKISSEFGLSKPAK